MAITFQCCYYNYISTYLPYYFCHYLHCRHQQHHHALCRCRSVIHGRGNASASITVTVLHLITKKQYFTLFRGLRLLEIMNILLVNILSHVVIFLFFHCWRNANWREMYIYVQIRIFLNRNQPNQPKQPNLPDWSSPMRPLNLLLQFQNLHPASMGTFFNGNGIIAIIVSSYLVFSLLSLEDE